MNVYEAISDYLMNSMYNENGLASRGALAAIVTEYDALAPDWANAPDWAQWYAIDADGERRWFEEEPTVMKAHGMWNAYGSDLLDVEAWNEVDEGIDWRLCKWSREVTK